eukprot:jgi/Orpsp1_1/1177245/evm.model.c7180000060681.2
MKYIKYFFVNSLLLSVVNCGVIKRSTGNIGDFSKYSGISELIQANKASFPSIFKDGPIYSGEGTAYGSATNGGNCLFPKDEYYKDMMYAAINRDQYLNDLGCGACALVVSTSNPYKPIRIRVIDQCPECKHGDLDFSDKAYKALTNQSPGRIKITWALIPCDIAVEEYPPLVSPGSDIKFQFKTGSSATWTEVQVFNTRYPVARVEAKVNGAFTELKRRDYNYWSNGAGLGAGPFDFRVTLADGSVIDATGVEFAIQGNDEDATFASGRQTVSGGSKSAGGSPVIPSNNNNNNNSNIGIENVGAPTTQAPTNQAPNQNTSTNTKTIPSNLGGNDNNNNNNSNTNTTLPPKNPTTNLGGGDLNNNSSTSQPSTPPTTPNVDNNNNNNGNSNGNPWGNNDWFNNKSWNWGNWNKNNNSNNNNNGSVNNASPWGMWNWGNMDWMKGWNKSNNNTPNNAPTSNAVAPNMPNWWMKNQW